MPRKRDPSDPLEMNGGDEGHRAGGLWLFLFLREEGVCVAVWRRRLAKRSIHVKIYLE